MLWKLLIRWVLGQCSVQCALCTRASNEGHPKVPKDFTITKKAPTRSLSWLKVPTNTIKTLYM